ncbi:cytochrome P450 [Penicillium maclennaniae]|uniref:cytochrome P450 n=1 Tax=Penicillium maclennaniae TaxID=1343394 RepID=UPI0025419E05|nr:cytochrome P450 [Penicillium maclennaniae]KAJ5668275.1 cytochrome P450 [Penicillium maclennaniae]
MLAEKIIPEGALVSVSTLCIHHDPAVSAEADDFDVSRWMNDSASESSNSFYPFSFGPRACIGRN